MSNAIKYSGENSSIQIASHVNKSIHLSVKDHGIGISREDQARLFERFFRASNSGNIQGTGLGLHIMKHYVDMLHGHLKLIAPRGKELRLPLPWKTRSRKPDPPFTPSVAIPYPDALLKE